MLSIEKSKKEPQRRTKIIYKYDWKGINYPSGKDNWKKFDKNNVALAPFVLC